METLVGYNGGRENVDAMSRRKLPLVLRILSASCRSNYQKPGEPRPANELGRSNHPCRVSRRAVPDSRREPPRDRNTGKTNMFMINKDLSPRCDEDQCCHDSVKSLKKRSLLFAVVGRKMRRKKDTKYEG
jgi:hypothetical protein